MEVEAKWASEFEKDMAEFEKRIAPLELPEDMPDLIPQRVFEAL